MIANDANVKSRTEEDTLVPIPELPFCETRRVHDTPNDPAENPLQDDGENEDCNNSPFYLYLHGRLGKNGVMEMTHNEPRRLVGKWLVALSQIDFNQKPKIAVESEDISILVLARKEYDRSFKQFVNSVTQTRGIVVENNDNAYVNFPHAAVIKLKKSTGQFATTPEGLYNFAEWRELVVHEMNEAFQDYVCKLDLQRGCEFEYRIVNSWNFAKNYDKQVLIFPIFGPKTRRLLDFPEVDSSEFKQMIENLITHTDAVLGFGKFSNIRSNIAVECSVAEHNGPAGKGHECFYDYDPDGHLLRNVRQDPESVFGKRVFFEYNESQRNYIPVGIAKQTSQPVNLKLTKIAIRLISSDTRYPLCCDGSINLTLHFIPENEFVMARSSNQTRIDEGKNVSSNVSNTVALLFSNNYVNIDSSNFDLSIKGKAKTK